jgi:two-component system nitrogen regulation sensor histidine kinase GlnL
LLTDELGICYANPAAENLFELSKRQLVGHSAGSVFGEAPALFQAIDKALASGASYTEQELELGVAGKLKLHLSCTVSVVDIPGAMMILEFRHIDQQLKIAREERLLEQQQANRDLIRSLAHEIKNPLGGIRGAAQLLEHELDRPPLIEYTQVIIGEADRLQTLVDRLLTPHRLPKFRRTNIHELLVRVGSVLQAEFPQILIHSDFDISLPEFEADPEQLTQALFNIVRNAAQALQGISGVREIRLRTRVARGITLAKRRYRLALALSVEDNGPGVPEAIRDKIFFPLVSGREGGSGLGLTIAQTFIAQHNGAIECESVPGHTVFTVLLPLELNRPGV